jgi:hypothetical protein
MKCLAGQIRALFNNYNIQKCAAALVNIIKLITFVVCIPTQKGCNFLNDKLFECVCAKNAIETIIT